MKVVINRCYGGFSLSNRAIKAVAERKGIPCHFFRRSDGLRGPYVRITDQEAFDSSDLFGIYAFRVESADLIPDQSDFSSLSLEQRKASNAAYDAVSVPYCRDIPRDDADLVAVVEGMGKAANGRRAELEVIEIPDGIDWEVDEYDGLERVVEAHRSWP